MSQLIQSKLTVGLIVTLDAMFSRTLRKIEHQEGIRKNLMESIHDLPDNGKHFVGYILGSMSDTAEERWEALYNLINESFSLEHEPECASDFERLLIDELIEHHEADGMLFRALLERLRKEVNNKQELDKVVIETNSPEPELDLANIVGDENVH